LTATLEDKLAVLPVTVITRDAELPPVLSTAVKVPAGPVTLGCVTCKAPAAPAPVAAVVNVTGTPDSTLLPASSASAVIVAVVEPSLKMLELLVDRVNDATAEVVAPEVETTCT